MALTKPPEKPFNVGTAMPMAPPAYVPSGEKLGQGIGSAPAIGPSTPMAPVVPQAVPWSNLR